MKSVLLYGIAAVALALPFAPGVAHARTTTAATAGDEATRPGASAPAPDAPDTIDEQKILFICSTSDFNSSATTVVAALGIAMLLRRRRTAARGL